MRVPVEDKEETKLQMAPMIDMVFLLVIFFMTASHLSSSQSLRMEIPEASRGVIPKERADRWVVNIVRDGTVYSGHQRVELDQLKTMIAERLKVDPNVKAYIRAEKQTPHKDVKRVMNVVASAGVADFIFGVYAKERRENVE
jgi:biopolymer transport protein ExbD